MSYDSLIECGRELCSDITSGLIKATDLTISGRAKLSLWLESAEFRVSCLTDEELEHMAAQNATVDVYKYSMARAEQEYRAANKNPSLTEQLLEDEDE